METALPPALHDWLAGRGIASKRAGCDWLAQHGVCIDACGFGSANRIAAAVDARVPAPELRALSWGRKNRI